MDALIGDGRYRITIRPETRYGFFGEKNCLQVEVYDQEKWTLVGWEKTRKDDQDEARALAARMISEWEKDFSQVTL